MTDKTQLVEQVLDKVRLVTNLLKDTNIPTEEADRAIGRVLAELDQLITAIDSTEEN